MTDTARASANRRWTRDQRKAAHLEIIDNMVTPLGAYVEQMGGGTTAWRVNLPQDRYALITFHDADHEGNPAAPHWMAGRYAEGMDQLDLHADRTLAQAVAIVRCWMQQT